MDRAAFLLERETLRRRMEERRQESASEITARQQGFVPRLLRTGAGVLLGVGAQGESVGWISSLLWAVAVPALMGIAQRGGDALVQKLVHVVFPEPSSKEPSRK